MTESFGKPSPAHANPPENAFAFPADCVFAYPWRPYQARALADLDAHLADRRFHVVAAPGSGKTVLGLEVIRRLGRPALVLAPTLGVRDQWIQRFVELFLRASQPPPWISRDLESPGLLTVSTYQSLHARLRKEPAARLAQRLQEARVETLALDEAHHLRNSWWKALADLVSALKHPFLVSLTATPPYDVPQLEWNRYASVCGEVDAEIGAAELVKAGSLCPHQDYIFFSRPAAGEEEIVRRFYREIASFVRDLCLDTQIQEAVAAHPALAEPKAHLAALLEKSDYYLSLAIYLTHARGTGAEAFLRALELDRAALPAFHLGWAEVFLNGLLFHDRDAFAACGEEIEALRAGLARRGAIERGQVLLRSSGSNIRLLRSSRSKLDSIAAIVELESQELGWRMRMAVLADHVREDAFPRPNGPSRPLDKLGVAPIFERLRRLRLPGVKLGVLTGRLVVAPGEALPALRAEAEAMGLAKDALRFAPLAHDESYARIETAGGDPAVLLALMTRIFRLGAIDVLVGTAALLGEGWDAPEINALILATGIGSYVSSNQLRGRAIRIDPAHEFKTANIWHLACLAPQADGFAGGGTDGEAPQWEDDLALMRRRFKTYSGPTLGAADPLIENGLERLGLPDDELARADVEPLNARMRRLAADRQRLAGQWRKAIDSSQAGYGRLATEALLPAARFSGHVVHRWLAGFEAWWSRRLRSFLLERRAERTARAVLEALASGGFVPREAARAAIRVAAGERSIRAWAPQLKGRDEALFIESLRQTFDPLLSPRYLLVARKDFVCVPRALGTTKELALLFQSSWRRHAGKARLVYTRAGEGRLELLRAKQKSLASRFEYETDTRVVWV